MCFAIFFVNLTVNLSALLITVGDRTIIISTDHLAQAHYTARGQTN